MLSQSKIKNNKSAQGEVVSTILLILLVIVTIGIITAFAIPFVRNQISKSDCLEVIGEDKLGISENMQYTCYESSNNKMIVQVHVGDIYDKIEGFGIVIGGATTKTYEIKKSGASSTDVSSYDGSLIQVPEANTERTYNISSITPIPQTVQVYPILTNGNKCDISDSLTSIPGCLIL